MGSMDSGGGSRVVIAGSPGMLSGGLTSFGMCSPGNFRH